MRFSDSFLDEIRQRVPISQVVGRKVVWDRRKSMPQRGDYWACCPFHQEKSPSFHADDRKGRYHCFGCKASGDIFTFLTEKEGLSFPEAVERLAAEAGLPMPEPSPEMRQREEKRTSLIEVMELAARFFEGQLAGRGGEGARRYLDSRGMREDLRRRFRLGFAPDDRYALKTHLAEKGVTTQQMVEAGLLIAGDDIPVPYDRFRNRVMFPINDARGRVVAFGGRALSPTAQAKYLNSPETELFHKSAMLYNLDRARKPAYEAGAIVVVEGYMDVIALDGVGIDHVVAPMGTALTAEQLKLLWKAAAEPVLCFDGDEAGLKAAYRALDTALPELRPGYSLRFAFLPEGQDPDDLVRHGGPAAMLGALEAAVPMADVLWRRESEAADLTTPERRAAFEAKLDEAVERISDARIKAHYRSHFRERLAGLWGGRRQPFVPRGRGYRGAGAPSSLARYPGGNVDQWRRGRAPLPHWLLPSSPTPALRARVAATGGDAAAGDRRERLIMLTLLNHPYLIEPNPEAVAELELSSPVLDRLRREILDIAALVEGLDRTELRNHLTARGYAEVLARLESGFTHRSDWFAFPDAAAEDTSVAWLHMVALHRKAGILRRELADAERAFAENPTEETELRLNEASAQFRSTFGEEAAIEGFGEASGRQGGSAV
ncbi:DNA primase [Rhodoligotrophos defluvii]|uniref:DNA primase n=1 Tax=Rhodoligotrophos defluvii TaxID=2561934 RepID=UPI0010C950B7|nr:DNA primase [Rhodoligotrophos defluvii]